MKTTEWLLLAVLLLVGTVSNVFADHFIVVKDAAAAAANKNNTITTKNKTDQEDVDDFVPFQGERFNIFDWNLLQNMVKSHSGNLLISPVSLKLALVLLYEGAQDQTAHELATVMHLPVGRVATRDRFTNILHSLKTPKAEYALSIGTRMFIDESIVLRQRYGILAKSFYRTDVIKTNFTNTKPTAQMINNFIKNVTNGQIETIVDNEKSLKDNVMIIVSGMFFKGTWNRQPFAENETKVDKFYLSDKKSTIQVPYMRASSKFYMTYSEELEAKILRLPYAGNKLAMFIILPQEVGDLPQVIRNINPALLNRHMWLMQEMSIDVMIPKFKIDFTSHMESHLRELGIRDIFDDTATLTGILLSRSSSRRLVVSDIVQKAGIEVSERGTIASTATKIEIGNKMNDETFHATQPFVFYIEDESTGTILYMGVVDNPLEESGIPTTTPSRFGGSSDDAAPVAATAVGMNDADRQNFFNVELLRELSEDRPTENLIVGTSSVRAALMVLAEAAGGRTQSQLRSTLRLSFNVSDWRELANQTFGTYKDAKSDTQLQTAIKLWTSKGLPVQKNYTDIVQRYYRGDLEAVNFGDVAGTVKTVNKWVHDYTHGEIKTIVDQNSLPADTKMLLTTAVYFKGVWQNAFDINSTTTQCFNVPNVGCQKVPMMENVYDYRYADLPALDAEVVEVPYTGEKVSMLVILPKRDDEEALDDLSRDLSHTPISALLSVLEKEEVELHLPRFTISNKLDLRSNLMKLGVRDLFDKNANLTTAFPGTPVQVGAVMHNAQIEVSEEGTVAAAVTGVSVIPLMGSNSKVFRADRPFIFLLLDLHNNETLFSGRFVKP